MVVNVIWAGVHARGSSCSFEVEHIKADWWVQAWHKNCVYIILHLHVWRFPIIYPYTRSITMHHSPPWGCFQENPPFLKLQRLNPRGGIIEHSKAGTEGDRTFNIGPGRAFYFRNVWTSGNGCKWIGMEIWIDTVYDSTLFLVWFALIWIWMKFGFEFEFGPRWTCDSNSIWLAWVWIQFRLELDLIWIGLKWLELNFPLDFEMRSRLVSGWIQIDIPLDFEADPKLAEFYLGGSRDCYFGLHLCPDYIYI